MHDNFTPAIDQDLDAPEFGERRAWVATSHSSERDDAPLVEVFLDHKRAIACARDWLVEHAPDVNPRRIERELLHDGASAWPARSNGSCIGAVSKIALPTTDEPTT
jgi:hypothetical protein